MSRIEYLEARVKINHMGEEEFYPNDSVVRHSLFGLGLEGWKLISRIGDRATFSREITTQHATQNKIKVNNDVLDKLENALDKLFECVNKSEPSETLDENLTCNDQDFDIKDCVLIKYLGKAEAVKVPDGVTKINDFAFEGNSTITSVVLPQGLQVIGNSAFCMCKNLKTINLPESLIQIDKRAFFFCEKLETISLPTGIKRICEDTFQNCINLTAITIPAVQDIGSCAFMNCENIKNVSMPDTLSNIGIMAFHNCKNLTISAREGNCAQKYAKRQKIPFDLIIN